MANPENPRGGRLVCAEDLRMGGEGGERREGGKDGRKEGGREGRPNGMGEEGCVAHLVGRLTCGSPDIPPHLWLT